VLTVLAQEATGLPYERIFASGTVLDTSRLRWKIAQRGRLHLQRARPHRGRARRHRVPAVVAATVGNVPILDWQPPRRPGRSSRSRSSTDRRRRRDAAYKVIQGGGSNHAIGLSSAHRRGDPRR
jgi:L-lactate dehydrogenase